MLIRDRLAAIGRYLLERLSEPSTVKGLILAASALGWWKLDSTSEGEGLAQIGLLVVGVINAALPQSTLYRK